MRILSALAFASITIACSGTGPVTDASPSSAGSAASAMQTLTDSCEGRVKCLAGSTETWATLHRDAKRTGCVVQGATLLPGGTVEGNAEASWTSEADDVRVCQGPSCFTCKRSDGAAPDTSTVKGPKEKACKGSAYCPSSPPCSDVRGCNLHVEYRYDGKGNVVGYDNTCIGSAEPCSEMTNSVACESQGCRWE